MIFWGRHNEQYVTTRELGRGGEGTVYELRDHHDLVLKKYNEPLNPERLRKLELMTSMRTPAIEAYAAWPADIVHDDTGAACGFVMKKLTGYMPLHHVFSPMDRKKMFPDKGYNFLVHVARNVATAFYRLHAAGLVVGDVNEGNILVNAAGMVAFIDCDSFQVRDGNEFFFCEVGVPRYTPPELLKKKTFDNVVRTANTDNFSMAVLIFQLLFLGRHPYAGKNKTTADIDEETAIRLGHFAYSLHNEKKKLSPPADSMPITSLPQDVIALFHRAFEEQERPVPLDWMKALAALLDNMATCAMSRVHSYPADLAECPWCAFRKERGILYFLDDSYLQANAILGDIEQFINGFKPQKPDVKKWAFKAKPPALSPTPAPRDVTRARWLRNVVSITLALAGILVMISMEAYFAMLLLLPSAYIYKSSGWARRLRQESKTRAERFFMLRKQLEAMVQEYEQPADLDAYNRGVDTLQMLIHDFRRLHDELERRYKLLEEDLYNEQLDDYLRQFDIESHTIPSISKARKSALQSCGIWHAAHISKLATTKVPGIGPAYEQVLMAWRRQMAAGFVYIPDTYRLGIARQKAMGEVAVIKQGLEQRIRSEYQSLNFLKLNINNRASVLEGQLNALYVKVRQAEVDIKAFNTVAA